MAATTDAKHGDRQFTNGDRLNVIQYAVIPAAGWNDASGHRVKGHALANVLRALAGFSDVRGSVYPSYTTLCELTGLGRRTVQRALEVLRDRKIIRRRGTRFFDAGAPGLRIWEIDWVRYAGLVPAHRTASLPPWMVEESRAMADGCAPGAHPETELDAPSGGASRSAPQDEVAPHATSGCAPRGAQTPMNPHSTVAVSAANEDGGGGAAPGGGDTPHPPPGTAGPSPLRGEGAGDGAGPDGTLVDTEAERVRHRLLLRGVQCRDEFAEAARLGLITEREVAAAIERVHRQRKSVNVLVTELRSIVRAAQARQAKRGRKAGRERGEGTEAGTVALAARSESLAAGGLAEAVHELAGYCELSIEFREKRGERWTRDEINGVRMGQFRDAAVKLGMTTQDEAQRLVDLVWEELGQRAGWGGGEGTGHQASGIRPDTDSPLVPGAASPPRSGCLVPSGQEVA